MSLDIKDAVGLTKVLKTTLASGEHTPHHIVDGTVAVSGPLTDTQLRATAVPVALDNNSLSALENISVTFPSTQNVSVQNASLAITAASLPLPSGAATSANQSTLIGHVDGIEGLLTTIDTDTGSIDGKVPSGLTVSSTRLLVDGSGVTQPVSGTFWQTTQPVSGPLTDTELRATAVPVSGTFWQATQPVSGSVTGLSDKGSVSGASTQSITTGGTHQQVFASNSSRKYLLVQNLSDTDMYLGIGFNPSSSTPDGILLSKSGGGIVFESNFIPTQEIRIVCATTGKRFEALEG